MSALVDYGNWWDRLCSTGYGREGGREREGEGVGEGEGEGEGERE